MPRAPAFVTALLASIALALACAHLPPKPVEQVELRAPEAAEAGSLVVVAIDASGANDEARDEACDGGPSRCDVVVGALLDANVYRGVPRSPSRDETLRHLSPATQRAWAGRDHARAYLECRYALTMNGRRYTYAHVLATGFNFDAKLDTARCSALDTLRAVQQHVRETTKQCTDPHAGAYWGDDLVSVP